MTNQFDLCKISPALYFLPVETRVPLKFGPETLTEVTCARVCLTVTGMDGRTAQGWGETPLSVQWVWPSDLTFAERQDTLKAFCITLAKAWSTVDYVGHALEIGHTFQQEMLPTLLAELNSARA